MYQDLPTPKSRLLAALKQTLSRPEEGTPEVWAEESRNVTQGARTGAGHTGAGGRTEEESPPEHRPGLNIREERVPSGSDALKWSFSPAGVGQTASGHPRDRD